MKYQLLKSAFCTSILMFSAFSQAETFWSDNSISYLKNTSDFQLLKNDNINVLTFEHTSGHNWGDTFFFVDRITASKDSETGEHKETYGEVSPRLSLSYLTNNKLQFGPIKDIFIATTYEHSSVTDSGTGFGFNNYLLGIGTAWEVTGFTFLNTNLYYASNDDVDDDIQLTASWGYPISIGEQQFMFDGFFDWASSADDHSADFHFNPQLRWDLGANFGNKKFVEIGVEYSYWHNKFGINNLKNENVISAMVKIHL
jgi:nucleoside-specific outer membrane channel protein Tsx